MLKFLKLGLAALVMVFAVSACGGPDAKGTVNTYISSLYGNDVQKLMSVIDFKGAEIDPNQKEMIEGKLGAACEAANKAAEVRGGYSKHEVLSIEQNPNDKAKSIANVKVFFKDGSSDEMQIKLVEVEGKIKVSGS